MQLSISYKPKRGDNQLLHALANMSGFIELNFNALTEGAQKIESAMIKQADAKVIKIEHPEKGETILTFEGLESINGKDSLQVIQPTLEDLKDLDNILTMLITEYERNILLPPDSQLIGWLTDYNE